MTRILRRSAVAISWRTKSFGVVDPPTAYAIGNCEPPLADHRDLHVARPYRLLDSVDGVLPETDVLDIHEDLVQSEPRSKAIVETTGGFLAVLAEITNEDARTATTSQSAYHGVSWLSYSVHVAQVGSDIIAAGP